MNFQATTPADRVSIITPAYRAAAHIEATIRSVRNQSFPHWEMIVADDCSPDDTRAVVEAQAAIDPRIRLLPLSQNGGPARARNAALEAASGRWIAFLDSDDLWLPDKLEKQLHFHKGSGAALTCTGFRRISAGGERTGRYIAPPSSLDYRRALGLTGIATSTVMIDLERAGPVRMKPVYYDDFACWLDVLRDGELAKGLDEDLMRYRVMAGSISRNKLHSAKEVWKQLRTVERVGLPLAIHSFGRYAFHATLKYSRF
jgi:teichuronic acid biosynthesis glycosyltransferase TuaG